MPEFLIGSVLAAAATGLGAVPALIFRKGTHQFKDILLGFCAGVMMAAAVFELIPRSLQMSDFIMVALGVFAGVLFLSLLETTVPHQHMEHDRGKASGDRKAFLIVAAIALHNLPEGLSVGVSYGSGVEGLGPLIALAIGLQNMPEGFLVAIYLIHQRVRAGIAFLIALLTGMVEFIAAVCGYLLTGIIESVIPFGLAFAAGSMLYIIYKELIPESHGDGHALLATYSFITGLIGMLWLISWF
ncbi:ZIP family metal transporter [Alteribacter natronophilus]|uniref:ZIP family metal transporter n=1 Tax=Alteribacter natronophilus TaxID=2583810 RepID=UPI00110E5161|nr:ZIP family metal transporter [Alteribacter natronophilus]TMW73480.1 ZIP family metal transporter [Alteribacter natronophilus]